MTTVRQWLESIGYELFPLMSESDRDQTGTVNDPNWRDPLAYWEEVENVSG